MSAKRKLTDLQRPFICYVITETTTQKVLKQIDLAEEGGASAVEINLACLKEIERKVNLRDIFGSNSLPAVATCRRSTFMKVYGFENLGKMSESERAEILLDAVDNGASAIDFELDLFDESSQMKKPSHGRWMDEIEPISKPTELKNDRIAIKQQMELLRKAKSIGAQVLISSHTQSRISKRGAVRIGKIIEARGADLAKIVMTSTSPEDILEIMDAAKAMKRTMRVPFNLMTVGEGQVIGRLLSLLFGSSWIYCRSTTGKHIFEGQPTMDETLAFMKRSKRLDF